MKPTKYILQQSVFIAGLLFLLACRHESPATQEKSAHTNATEKAAKAGQFSFYKDIEVKPGMHFEIISWGKGVDSVGGYQILMSDSTKNNFRSLAVEREGVITDVWNMDLDNDGNPELYIELLSKQNVKDLQVYEYQNNSFNKINFPPLSARAKKNYTGGDKFFIKNGDLFRTYPYIADSSDTTAVKGALKTLVYQLRGNSFSVDEIKVD
ncbi:hypothetical protein [Pedobacter antarcticus]|uniref:hypothetical protein n=1 Tax=Pedobacter antarcticus TaxID=34086 RepID=UPI000886D714|nr:hypothetical protein [Pedobacter antarcticus]SDL73822.1 hypothetical protein SAMN04488084_102292 [Pedobacter antarcticus]